MRDSSLKIDSCPLNFYCHRDFRLNNIGICSGETGDYRDCICYRNHIEQGLQDHDRTLTKREVSL